MLTSLGLNERTISLRMLLKISICVLFVLHIISYFMTTWTTEVDQYDGEVLLFKYAYSNRYMEIVRYAVFALIIAIVLSSIRCSERSWLYMLLFVISPIIYTIDAVLEMGISTALYSGNLPIIYLLAFSFFLGRRADFWEEMKSMIPWLLVAYGALFVFEFFTSYSRFGWAIYQNSSLMSYYSHLFWVSLLHSYVTITERKKMTSIYLLMFILLAGAIILRSRSWLLQSLLFILILNLAIAYRRKRDLTAIFRATTVIAIVVVAFAALIMMYLGDYVVSLFDKGMTDSRSFQYGEMLAQVKPHEWLFGKGMNATYESSLYGDYHFIDNEFFYLSFHYGIGFAIVYFLPCIMTIYQCLKNRKSTSWLVFSVAVVFMWVLSINGLSVFNRIHLDIKSFIMPFFMGHVYQTAKNSSVAENDI